jgi:exo-1,4-beta-D-glucosaminidase
MIACLPLAFTFYACQSARPPLQAQAPATATVPTPALPASVALVTTTPAKATPAKPVSVHCFECNDGRFYLHDGWSLQAAAKLKTDGRELSQPGYVPLDWSAATVPSTVLAALVAAKVYPDPFEKNNLAAIPAAAFKGPYWYRTEFILPADFDGQATFLDLDGVNYSANVWLNGQPIATVKDIIGTFTSHELNVSAWVHAGKPNALAIQVFPPDIKRDLTLTWNDWNPTPPDRNMGVYRDVYLKRSGAVAVRGARVVSKLDLKTLAAAELGIKAELTNTTDHAVKASLEGSFNPTDDGSVAARVSVTQDVELAPRETKTVSFEAPRFPQLSIKQPKLWWPAQLGTPNQYDLQLQAKSDGKVSDRAPLRFGIRSISFDAMPEGHRQFRVNGKPVMIRGGGWASDMLLRSSDERLETELAFAKDLNFNNIRTEGKLETDDFYAKADAYGFMITPGWMCCDRWQESKRWSLAERAVGRASMATQARRLRNHPSVIEFMVGSDEAPSDDVERDFVDELQKAEWPNVITNAAAARTSPILGKSGRKMTGPYDWVSPEYWYQDRTYGGAVGFNSETCPGPAVPELETLQSWLTPSDLRDLWSKPRGRQAHAGTPGTRFDNLSVFNLALAARLGKATSLDDYLRKAQLMSYEAQRVMFESYSRGKNGATSGIVQWLMNSAWPSLIWHLYAYDFSTSGGYFGAKKANEPLHIQYSYDDRSVVLVNQTPEAVSDLRASVEVYDAESHRRYAQEVPASIAADAAAKLMLLPPIASLSQTYFVSLRLSKGGSVVSQNFYWLSQKPELSDYKRTDWDYTPVKQFADFKPLADLPSAVVKAKLVGPEKGRVRLELENTSPVIALLVSAKLTRGGGGPQILPALWQDNYVSLLPGEKRQLSVAVSEQALIGSTASVEISGWNVSKTVANAK